MQGEKIVPADEVHFTSARQWSAASFDHERRRGTYVLGSLEALAPHLPNDATADGALLSRQIREWSKRGLRVLVFACNADTISLHNAQGAPVLAPLTPLAVIGLADELRPEARETVVGFQQLGIQIKLISGDDPGTVAALADQAGLAVSSPPVSGLDLDRMTTEQFNTAVSEAVVFGRIGPHQKERIVAALIAQGHYVAMIGDGVNDVLALKTAQLGIAMRTGSEAARHVADMTLLNDFLFSATSRLPGRKTGGSGRRSAMCLHLTRDAVATLIIVAVSMLGLGFPFEPAQVALTYLTAGIPSFFLILWAKPDIQQTDVLRSLVQLVIPAAILSMVIGVALYTAFYTLVLKGMQTYQVPTEIIQRFEAFTGVPHESNLQFGPAAATIVAQTVLSIFITVAGFLLILFLAPPLRVFTGWTEQSADRRPALLVLTLVASLVAIVAVPELGRYFALFPFIGGPSPQSERRY